MDQSQLNETVALLLYDDLPVEEHDLSEITADDIQNALVFDGSTVVGSGFE